MRVGHWLLAGANTRGQLITDHHSLYTVNFLRKHSHSGVVFVNIGNVSRGQSIQLPVQSPSLPLSFPAHLTAVPSHLTFASYH